MYSFFKNLFSTQDEVDFVNILKEGAVLIDVRSKDEYKAGHAKKSINLPLDELNSNFDKIKKGIPIIVVCQSGMRSKMAQSKLKKAGFNEVHNGGCWSNFI